MSARRTRNKAPARAPARRDPDSTNAAGGDVSVRRDILLPATFSITRHSGPLPAPADLFEYETALPGLADRIVAMAEAEGRHRRLVEQRLVWLSFGGLGRAFVLAALAISGGIFLADRGKPAEGLATIVGALAALVAVFILGRKKGPPDAAAEPEEQPKAAA